MSMVGMSKKRKIETKMRFFEGKSEKLPQGVILFKLLPGPDVIELFTAVIYNCL